MENHKTMDNTEKELIDYLIDSVERSYTTITTSKTNGIKFPRDVRGVNLLSCESSVDIKSIYTFDYKNGFVVKVIMMNGKIQSYAWIYSNRPKEVPNEVPIFYSPNIQELQKIHYSDDDYVIWLQLWSEEKFKTLNDFDNFTEFDHLYYGGRWNGMLYKYNGDHLSCTIKADYITLIVNVGIKTLQAAEEFLEKSKKYPWVSNCEIIDIPGYNWDDPDIPETSVEFTFLAPQEIFDKAIEFYNINQDSNNYCFLSKKDGIITYIGEGIINETF